jgi:ribosome maturation factor RimP
MEYRLKLESLVSPTLDQMGYELVRIQMQGQARPTLQIMAERKDGGGMTVEDCALISRALSAVLDVEDPVGGAYVLEVSSPGIDRPLTRAKDFRDWVGFEAKVDTDLPVNGQKRFKGKLLGLDETGRVGLATEKGESWIPLPQVKSARLVLTDELIAAVTKDTSEG